MPALRIANTSPLIFLSRVGLLDALGEPGVRVVVPEEVAAEIRAAGTDDPTVRALDGAAWIEIIPTPTIPVEVATWKLDAGEAAVLALGLEHSDCELILDDRRGRLAARALGMTFRGTLSIVLFAKELGRISAVRPVLEELRRSGMYLTDRIIEETLARVGES